MIQLHNEFELSSFIRLKDRTGAKKLTRSSAIAGGTARRDTSVEILSVADVRKIAHEMTFKANNIESHAIRQIYIVSY